MLRPTPARRRRRTAEGAGADRLASEQRAEHRRAHRQPGLQLLLRGLRRLAFDGTPRRGAAARRAAPASRCDFLRTASTAASRASRCDVLNADPEVALALARRRGQLEIAMPEQLELLVLRQPLREVLLPGGVVPRLERRRRAPAPNAAPGHRRRAADSTAAASSRRRAGPVDGQSRPSERRSVEHVAGLVDAELRVAEADARRPRTTGS